MDIIGTTETSEIELIKNTVTSICSDTRFTTDFISQQSFLGDANLEVKELLPNWLEIFNEGGDNLLRLKSIVRKSTLIKLLRLSKRNSGTNINDINQTYDIVKVTEVISQYTEEIFSTVSFLKGFGASPTNAPIKVVGGKI